MSYNVTKVECLALDAKIHFRTLRRLLNRVEMHEGDGKAPPENFLAAHANVEPDADGFITLKNLRWTGEWSGHALELFESILTEIDGTAEIVLTWEGGDCVTGYRVRDGLVEGCDVVRALGAAARTIKRAPELPAWSTRGDDMHVTHGQPEHAILATVTVLPRRPGELDARFDATVHTEDGLSSECFGSAEAAKLWCEEKLAELGYRVAREKGGAS
jgi:hypothetical protein